MAKTLFLNNSILTPDFVNGIYNTSGGHVHDGGANDGSSSKINLVTHVTGLLPVKNQTLPYFYLTGFKTFLVTSTQVYISAGTCIDSSNSYSMALTSPITKILTDGTNWSAWVQGNGGGGVPSGTTDIGAGVWMHIFVINNTTRTDIGFDSSLTAANLKVMAGGYTNCRRIGSVMVAGTSGTYHIYPYKQVGNVFTFDDPYLELSAYETWIPNAFTKTNTTFVAIPPWQMPYGNQAFVSATLRNNTYLPPTKAWYASGVTNTVYLLPTDTVITDTLANAGTVQHAASFGSIIDSIPNTSYTYSSAGPQLVSPSTTQQLAVVRNTYADGGVVPGTMVYLFLNIFTNGYIDNL